MSTNKKVLLHSYILQFDAMLRPKQLILGYVDDKCE